MPEDFTTGRVADKIKQSVDDSLLRLQRTHIDVLMLHNPVRLVRDMSVRVVVDCRLTLRRMLLELVLPALQHVKVAGKARYLGLACETSETAAVLPLLRDARIHHGERVVQPDKSVRRQKRARPPIA